MAFLERILRRRQTSIVPSEQHVEPLARFQRREGRQNVIGGTIPPYESTPVSPGLDTRREHSPVVASSDHREASTTSGNRGNDSGGADRQIEDLIIPDVLPSRRRGRMARTKQPFLVEVSDEEQFEVQRRMREVREGRN